MEYVWGGREVGTGEGLGRTVVVPASDLWKRRGEKKRAWGNGVGAMYIGSVVTMA